MEKVITNFKDLNAEQLIQFLIEKAGKTQLSLWEVLVYWRKQETFPPLTDLPIEFLRDILSESRCSDFPEELKADVLKAIIALTDSFIEPWNLLEGLKNDETLLGEALDKMLLLASNYWELDTVCRDSPEGSKWREEAIEKMYLLAHEGGDDKATFSLWKNLHYQINHSGVYEKDKVKYSAWLNESALKAHELAEKINKFETWKEMVGEFGDSSTGGQCVKKMRELATDFRQKTDLLKYYRDPSDERSAILQGLIAESDFAYLVILCKRFEPWEFSVKEKLAILGSMLEKVGDDPDQRNELERLTNIYASILLDEYLMREKDSVLPILQQVEQAVIQITESQEGWQFVAKNTPKDSALHKMAMEKIMA